MVAARVVDNLFSFFLSVIVFVDFCRASESRSLSGAQVPSIHSTSGSFSFSFNLLFTFVFLLNSSYTASLTSCPRKTQLPLAREIVRTVEQVQVVCLV
ncbi:hypothetical protein PNOK_0622600 [Pyrrhoderma noxium]|uniref:Uncharacterized protein n=1 Tax=Pyrrhoderma noxium TaxID=2282107 RepID=A0A286UDS6_9AGAM|nr:hypothetical protein PNOK_0622600 [Pyrrhoderma noxium]